MHSKLLMALMFPFMVVLASCGVDPPADPTPTPGAGAATPTATPTTEPPVQNLPAWLVDLAEALEQGEAANPPLRIVEYRYGGETVYFAPQPCCRILSDLYNAEGDLIAHPDGGIIRGAGGGDGRAPDFMETAELVGVVWDAEHGLVDAGPVVAPIEGAAVGPFGLDGFALGFVSGLPDGCHLFAGWEIDTTRLAGDRTIAVSVYNGYPVQEGQMGCTDVYRAVESLVPLPYAFIRGETYTVTVNDVSTAFTTGSDHAGEQAALHEARARWSTGGISDYVARFHWICFCGQDFVAPVLLTVEGGVLVDARYAADAGVEGSPDLDRYRTVEGLFDLVQEAIDQGAHRIEVEYDEAQGYPTNAFIDYFEAMADEEMGFSLELQPRED